eukprot:TRINITY_DN22814_c0_g1_i1.p1 TRINITY_DN22814_c0_g1~~TRINITY_DN22814_c0_g1_i1.p1  ORF type:complete len:584 (+),score=140.99 TRINITY_DN22814_c0_g1_i1:51-1754(+)
MGKKGKNRKYQPADPGNGSGGGGNHGSTPSWKTAGVGQRLGGSDAPPPVRPAGRPAAPAAKASASGPYAPPPRGPGGAPAGLRIVREAGDGSCLFNALARQALGDPSLAGRARTEICDWMRAYLVPSALASGRSPVTEPHRRMLEAQRAELFAGSDGDTRVLRYVERMRRPTEWGSGLEALSAAYVYGRPVHVWSRQGASVLEPPKLAAASSRPQAIRLMHNGRNHWNSLLPSTSGAEASAAAAASASASAELQEQEDAALAAALAASLATFDLGSSAASGAADGDAAAAEAPSASAPSSSDDRRAFAAAAALARQQQEDARGLSDAARAAELREAQVRRTLLGQLAERCARRKEEMPLGAGLMSLAALRVAVDARASAVNVGGVELGPCGPGGTAVTRGAAADVKAAATETAQLATDATVVGDGVGGASGASGVTARRWGRRHQARAPAADGDNGGTEASPSEEAPAQQPTSEDPLAESPEAFWFEDEDDFARDVAGATCGSEQGAGAPVLRMRLVENEGAEFESCMVALQRRGFGAEEAAQVIESCEGDLSRVRDLYSIDWSAAD